MQSKKMKSRKFESKFFKPKRAQAAMEFLMTYGWAILVVLAAIGALAYFGVLSPGKFVPESCMLPSTSGLACLDFSVTETEAHLFVMNSGGRDLILNNITIGDCTEELDVSFTDGTQQLINVSCDFGSAGEKSKKDLVLTYTVQESGFTKTASGSLTAQIV